MEYLSREFLEKFLKAEEKPRYSGDNNYFLNSFKQKVSDEEYKEKISQCTNLADVIRTVKPLYDWTPPGPEFQNLFRKRSDISTLNLTILSNGKCSSTTTTTTKETTKSCNRAVAYATSGQDLAAAYYKRSALLSALNDPIGALEQFQLALATRDSASNEGGIVKQLGRNLKTKSIAFKDLAEKREELEKREEWAAEREARKKFCHELFQLKSPHPKAPAMEDFIEIKFNSNIGRHLVVTKDVPIGTTLLVETPFITVLDGTLKLDVGNCHHCLKRNLQCIPCPNCVFALFCDENCRHAAASYHKFECPCLPDLRLSLGDGENMQAFYLAFKLVTKLGPENLWEIFQNLKKDSNTPNSSAAASSSSSFEPQIAGSNPKTSIYESDSYLPILHLTSNVQMADIEFSWPATALMLTSILDVNSNFFALSTFEKNPNLLIVNGDIDKFKDFVAETILHHFLCFCQNAYGLCEMDKMEGVGLQDKIRKNKREEGELGYCYYGRGVFGTASLINHACVPNVTRFSGLTFGTTVFISLRGLKKGEELVISYIPTFNSFNSNEISRMETVERQKDLASVYNFMCQCIACLNDWPTIIELEFARKQFKFCGLSSSSLSNLINNNNENYGKKFFGLDQCLQCAANGRKEEEKKICNFLAVHDEFCKHHKSIQTCHDGVMSNSPIAVMNMLKATMTFFDTHVAAPSYDLFVLQNLFDKCIELIIYFSE